MRYIVRLVDFGLVDNLITDYELRSVKILERVRMLVFEYDPEVDSFLISKLEKDPNVHYVQPDSVVTLDDDTSAEEVDALEQPNSSLLKSTYIGEFTNSATSQTGPEYNSHLEMLNSVDYGGNSDDHTYDTTFTGNGVDIYVVDTGVNFNHPELAGRVFRTENSINLENMKDADNNGHGTTSALFAAGKTFGVAQDARIYSLKALKGSKSGSSIDIIDSIDEAIRHHSAKNGSRPSVLNLSLGLFPKAWNPYVWGDLTSPHDHYLNDGAKQAVVAGMHVVIAAGNGFYAKDNADDQYVVGPMLSTYAPGTMHLSSEETGNWDPGQGNVIVVGAVETRPGILKHMTGPNGELIPTLVAGKMASFSNYGRGNTINAPGAGILTPKYDWDDSPNAENNRFKWGNGTSYACPMVSGLLALHLEGNPYENPEQVKDWLVSNANTESITNLMKPLVVPASETTIQNPLGNTTELSKYFGWHDFTLNNEDHRLVTLLVQGTLSPDFTEHFSVGDLIQFEFDDSETFDANITTPDGESLLGYMWWKDNIAEFNDGWWEVVMVDTAEEDVTENEVQETMLGVTPRLGFPTQQPLAGGWPIEQLGEPFGFIFTGELKIAKVSSTHAETDGVKIWQLENSGNVLTGSSGGRLQEVEYTDNLMAFNPYQSYVMDWAELETIPELRFPLAYNSSPFANVKLKTPRGESPQPTQFKVESGSLPTGVELLSNGTFVDHLVEPNPSDVEGASTSSTVTISATNGYETFTKTLDVIEDDTEVCFEGTLTITNTGAVIVTNDCICTEQWDPVCGVDGKTYGNGCMASCAGTTVDYTGECGGNMCICTMEYMPVCGEDGKTYSNRCVANCEGVEVVSDGPCQSLCPCTREYRPVCGEDGKTYSNRCLADCAGVDIVSKGACKDQEVLERMTTTQLKTTYVPVNWDEWKDEFTRPNWMGAVESVIEVHVCGVILNNSLSLGSDVPFEILEMERTNDVPYLCIPSRFKQIFPYSESTTDEEFTGFDDDALIAYDIEDFEDANEDTYVYLEISNDIQTHIPRGRIKLGGKKPKDDEIWFYYQKWNMCYHGRFKPWRKNSEGDYLVELTPSWSALDGRLEQTILSHDALSNVKNLIWYGHCGIPVESRDIADFPAIEVVYQLTDNGADVWKHDIPSHINQPFSKFEFGHAYYVILKSADGINPDETLIIPNAVVGGQGDALNINRC